MEEVVKKQDILAIINSLNEQTSTQLQKQSSNQLKYSQIDNPSIQEAKHSKQFTPNNSQGDIQQQVFNKNNQQEQTNLNLSQDQKVVDHQSDFINYIYYALQNDNLKIDDNQNQLQNKSTSYLNQKSQQENSQGGSRQSKGFQIPTSRFLKSQSLNFENFNSNQYQENENDEEFRTSLLNATIISKMNRDKLYDNLIKSNIIQQNITYQQDSRDYDDEEEASNMFPLKDKSLLISIQNKSQIKKSGNYQEQQIDSSNLNIMNLINSEQDTSQNKLNEGDYNQNGSQQILRESQQKLRESQQKLRESELKFKESDLKLRKSSSHKNLSVINAAISIEEDNEINEEQNRINKVKVILATAQSLPSQMEFDQEKRRLSKIQNQNIIQNNQSQMSIIKSSSNQESSNDSEYYENLSNNIYKSNLRESQNPQIKFRNTFFNNPQSQNLDYIFRQQNVRSYEMADSIQFNGNINRRTTDIPKTQNMIESKTCDKIKNPNCQLSRNSSKCQIPQTSNQIDNAIQSIGEAISLETFMQTKQCTVFKDWIQKRSSNIFVGWQKRWLVLKNKKLQYFKTDESTHYQGCIDFSFLSCQLEKVENKKKQIIELRIRIEGSSKVFRFQSPKIQQISLDDWANAIQQQIDFCSKIPFRPLHITQQSEFWKNDRISLNEFESLADTGDLLLFKGKTFGEKVIRNLINCEYNHIGLILRTNKETNNLLILESTGEEGVGLLSWKTFLKRNWQDLYDKIALRKLQAERTDEMLMKMEKYIRYAIGKNYQVSLSKLFSKKTDVDDLTQDPNRTFFCSELIAAIYKVCGYLPLDISSGNYWPSSFEGSRNLKLLNNTSLSEEFVIDFEI